jgi:hypothetical protein
LRAFRRHLKDGSDRRPLRRDHPKSPRRPTYRVPRHTVDAIGIRPIDLALIDGIEMG